MKFSVYGVGFDPICDRLKELFDQFEVEYVFFDMRLHPPTDELLKKWAEYLEEEYPTNSRSTLFKKQEKRFKNLKPELRNDWLREFYHVIQRPIVENEEGEVITIGGRPEKILKLIADIEI